MSTCLGNEFFNLAPNEFVYSSAKDSRVAFIIIIIIIYIFFSN
jgi:hypothetical protein